jgi:Protein of unknown function (DUF3108)
MRLTAVAVLGALALGAAPPPIPPGAEVSDEDITSSVILPAPGQTDLIPAPRDPVKPGESLKFAVNWGIINGGNAYLEVPEVDTIDGRPVLHLVARAESNGFISRFYKVRNTIQSWWDRDGRYTLRYSEKRHEGKYRKNSEIVFDHETRTARYEDGETFPVPPNVQDALSSFYYTRFQALPIGGSIVFDYHAGKKSKPLEVRVIGREHVKVPAGEFDCVAVEPVLKAGGIFRNEGRLVIWLTEDERRMPVLMKSKVTIGSVSVVLQEYRTSAG